MKTSPRRRLTLNTVNPLGTVPWRFQAFSLYGVVEPLTGECMIPAYERMNTENFQQFLNAFSHRYPTDFHVIQTDNARFHCAHYLVLPATVMLLYQPPYSPQVNSIEQVLEWVKGDIANQIFPTLGLLKETLNPLFLSKPKTFFALLTGRKFIFDALQKIDMLPDTV